MTLALQTLSPIHQLVTRAPARFSTRLTGHLHSIEASA